LLIDPSNRQAEEVERMASARPALALSALISGAIAISFALIFVKSSEISPAATAFHRILLSLPFFAAIHFSRPHATRRETVSQRTPETSALLMLTGAFFAADLAVWHWSIELTTVANATQLGNAAPIFVAVSAWALLGEAIGVRFIIGLVIAAAGTALVVGASFGGRGSVLGDALGLVTACFYAGYMICVKLLRRSVATLDIMMWSGLTAVPLLLVVALVSGESLIAMTLAGGLISVGLALVSHIIGQSLIAFSLVHLAASFSSLTRLIQPVGATVLAWLILDEGFQTQQALGSIAVLIGTMLARQRTVVRDVKP
jgi:drug/metabolite transporter (DMT)-like permease